MGLLLANRPRKMDGIDRISFHTLLERRKGKEEGWPAMLVVVRAGTVSNNAHWVKERRRRRREMMIALRGSFAAARVWGETQRLTRRRWHEEKRREEKDHYEAPRSLFAHTRWEGRWVVYLPPLPWCVCALNQITSAGSLAFACSLASRAKRSPPAAQEGERV